MQPAPNVLFVSSYPPRQCGIATFTQDLAYALREAGGLPFQVVAMRGSGGGYAYPGEVVFEIDRDRLADYRQAAAFANGAPVDVVSVQHEFGLFGGAAGAYLTEFLRHVEKPVVTTFHTVIRRPEPAYREATLALIRYSDRLVVMSDVARRILLETYGAPADRIELIPHGVPDAPEGAPAELKASLGLGDRFVILTFGFLSRNKGIHLMLEALPAVVAAHPSVLYVVLGATHPEVKRQEGEAYRESLLEKARELGITGHVRFIDEYTSLETLLRYIRGSDLYVTPYLYEEQVVSGTLSYALAMGKPIVSTPYWYAQELLAGGRGVVVPFGDPGAMARAIRSLIEDRELYGRIAEAAYRHGQAMRWPEVAARYARVFQEVAAPAKREVAEAKRDVAEAAKQAVVGATNGRAPVRPGRSRVEGRPAWGVVRPERGPARPDGQEVRLEQLPITLEPLRRLTDDTGLMQHATYGVPDPHFGYSADDAGRALVPLMELYARHGRTDGMPLAATYVKFLRYAQTPDGAFHNFVAYDRRHLDERGSEDTLGRVLWGLGHVVRSAPEAGLRELARDMVEAARPHIEGLHYPRAKAYAILGLHPYAKAAETRGGGARWIALIDGLSESLAGLYEAHAGPGWAWFEDTLTYGNAKLCEAMLVAYQATGKERFRRIGLASLDFLWEYLWNGEFVDLVGNEGWASRDGRRALFGQQPIDAGYLVEACATAYGVTGNPQYVQRAQHAFAWFLGRNRLGQPLVDPATGAVYDGLDAHGRSANQGAESLVCYLLARLAMERLAAAAADASKRAVSAAGRLVAGRPAAAQPVTGRPVTGRPAAGGRQAAGAGTAASTQGGGRSLGAS